MTVSEGSWKTITFLRHCEPKQSGGGLSNRGAVQARQRANDLKNCAPFDLIVYSSASRTQKTADIIAQVLNLEIPSVSLKALYLPCDAQDREKVKSLLEELGSKPLHKYIEHDTDKVWERYTKNIYDELLECISAHKAKNVLVIGHGNIINSLGLMINPDATSLQNVYFDYGEGFTIFKDTKHLSWIKNSDIL